MVKIKGGKYHIVIFVSISYRKKYLKRKGLKWSLFHSLSSYGVSYLLFGYNEISVITNLKSYVQGHSL